MKISDDVLKVLTRCTINGNEVALPEQLDRKLYVAVNKVLVAAGGKWSRSHGAHVFADAPDALEQAILVGEITTHQDIDFFPTPYNIMRLIISNADLRTHNRVLEPSAGTGAIAKEILIAGCAELVCIEKDDALATKLKSHVGASTTVIGGLDFLECKPERTGTFDRVIMNPPFSKLSDALHILYAWQFLKAGGRLVAIASAGINFREDKITRRLRNLIADHSGAIHQLPPGSFKSSGTMVNTVMVTIDNAIPF